MLSTIFIFLSIIIYFIKAEEFKLEYKYTKFFQLLNDNYIICSEKGIHLYDSQIKNKKSEFLFTSEITSVYDFYFVNIDQFSLDEGGQVIIIYKDTFYFYSYSGTKLFSCDLPISALGKGYTLVLYKNGENFNFMVGYIGIDKSTMVGYYNIDISNQKISEITTKNIVLDHDGDYEYKISEYTFSCQIMISNSEGKVLTCFYSVYYYLGINSYNISDNFSECSSIGMTYNKNISTDYIKSSTNLEKNKALLCSSNTYIRDDSCGICYYYDINKKEISSLKEICKAPQLDFYTIIISYSKKTNEFITSCLTYQGNFTINKFNQNLNEFEEIEKNGLYMANFKNSDCIDLNHFSIVFLSESNSYFLIANCDSANNVTSYSIPENCNPSHVNPSPSYNDEIRDNHSIFPKNNTYYYYDEKTNKTIFLEPDEKCPEQFLYKYRVSKECLKTCEITKFLNNDCALNYITLNNIDNITNDMRNILNNTNINKETNIKIQGDNAVYQIVSSTNMEDIKNNNLSVINLGDCEQKLKEYYKINSIIIFKIDLYLNNIPPIIVNYELYHPINLTKLNLSICKDMRIMIYSPYTPTKDSLNKYIKLNESGYDLYNPNDSFYQDICSTFTSDYGTDIILSDRQSDYFESIALCETICIYQGYNYKIEKAKCKCTIKEEIEIKFNKTLFLSYFKLDKYTNFKLLKCYELVFSKLGQKNNKGSYIFIAIIFFYISLFVIFYIYQTKNIAKIIRTIINTNFSNTNVNYLSSPTKKTIKRIKSNNGMNIRKNHFKKSNTIKKLKTKDLITKVSISKNLSLKSILPSEKRKKIKFNKKNNKKKYNDEELNDLDYNEAILYDKRSYCDYYMDLIKRKQLILFTFLSNKDYNIFHIKFSLFLFSFSLYFAVSGFFFEDKTMHKIYQNKGKLKLIYKIPPIIYSILICSLINIIIKYFALSNKDMLGIKKIKEKENAFKESVYLLKRLKIKFVIFFFISFTFILFFWYFISAFCAAYKNTQVILIENTIVSFGISLLYPFGFNLFPGFMRIASLKAPNRDLECLYKVSQIIAYLI